LDSSQINTSQFQDLYVPEKRRAVNGICLFLTSLLFVGGMISAYFISIDSIKYSEMIITIMMAYSGISLIRLFFYVIGALQYDQQTKAIKPVEELKVFPFISVLVPAYNEGKVIGDVIKNYRHIDYPNFEVIIVDDGSADDTFEQATNAATFSPVDIKVFKKPNGGKASALNFALDKARGSFVLCMDADSSLAPLTLKCGIRHFEDNPKLAAVAGKVLVENTDNMLGRMQYLDYLYGHLQKKILSIFRTVTIVPGPIGLFRKSDLMAIGGYEKENTTYAEDTELTLKLLTNGREITCDDGMISYTEAPTNYNDLYRQRYRWTRGIFQALLKNTHRFLDSDESKSHLVFFYLFWEQVLFPLIDFTLLFVFIFCCFFAPLESKASFLLLYIYFLDIVMAVMATKGEKDRWKMGFYAIWARFFYSNVLVVWKISAFYDEWIARGMTWDKLSRNGFSNTGRVN
jgi:cellulose synthase/poly-beta-1,6-N-acetylglucosamine synthase-like glycosyltransferase